PRRDIRFALQYTGYREFNGARSNYDGLGRNARDNNTLYLILWWMI
ncbi:MAG TPA: cytochrome C, partial [Casimicrobiaceae bacterium]|nr:cytochrome C [Casimicrobiaceae bacterium]